MLQMKSLLIVASIFCKVCLGANLANYLGDREFNEVLLYVDYREESPSKGSSETVFPHPDNLNPQFYITYIEHFVQELDDYPYTLKTTSGGIGHMNATIVIEQKDYGDYEYYDYGFKYGWLYIWGVHKSCYTKK